MYTRVRGSLNLKPVVVKTRLSSSVGTLVPSGSTHLKRIGGVRLCVGSSPLSLRASRFLRTHLNFLDTTTLRYFAYVVAMLVRFGKKLFYWDILSVVLLQLTLNGAVSSGGLGLALSGEIGVTDLRLEANVSSSAKAVKPSLSCSCVVVLAQTILSNNLASTYLYASLTPQVLALGGARSNTSLGVFMQLCLALKTSYVVRYKSLDRKLRKIVKNKYRFFRFYSMLKPVHRVRAGLRFILLGLALRSNQRMQARLLDILSDVLVAPEQSLLLDLKRKHQAVTLGALTLAM